MALEAAEHGVAADGVDPLHERQDLRDLAALHVADEVPGEAVAVRGVLGLEVLGAVLADARDAGVGERAEVLERDVLRRRDDLDVARVAPPLARAAAAAIRSRVEAPSRQPRDASLPAGGAVVAAVREEARVAHRAQPAVVDLLDARRAQPGRRDRLEVDVAPQHRLGHVGERLAHLVADLVAAASGAGPDRGGDGAGRADVAQRGDALLERCRRRVRASPRAPSRPRRGR